MKPELDQNKLPPDFSEQPAFQSLLDQAAATNGSVELFPLVWSAAEGLVSSDVRLRRQSLEQLISIDAPRLSPLVAYLVATRLMDQDIFLRRRAVQVVAGLLTRSSEANARIALDSVRYSLINHLMQMRTRQVYALLQVAVHDVQSQAEIARLLNVCPYAGRHLVDILSDRKAPLSVRRQSAELIGMVGYLDAIPAMERLEARLMTRLNGQQAMSFALLGPSIPGQQDEVDLLPNVQRSLMRLRSL